MAREVAPVAPRDARPRPARRAPLRRRGRHPGAGERSRGAAARPGRSRHAGPHDLLEAPALLRPARGSRVAGGRRPTRCARRWPASSRTYTAYFEAHRHGELMKPGAGGAAAPSVTPTLTDPYPRVVLLPGLGMFTSGKDARTAGIVADIYHHTAWVMRAASALGPYTSLSAQDAFNVEFWPLELYKLQMAPPEKELARRVALVTGGASGIGRAVARRLAREGAHVVVTDLDEAGARRVAEEAAADAGPARPLGLGLDVTSEASVEAAVAATVDAYGGLDIVVSNAGIAHGGGDRPHGAGRLGAELRGQRDRPLPRDPRGAAGDEGPGARREPRLRRDEERDVAGQGLRGLQRLQGRRGAARQGGRAGGRAARDPGEPREPDAVFRDSGLWSPEVREERARAQGIAVERDRGVLPEAQPPRRLRCCRRTWPRRCCSWPRTGPPRRPAARSPSTAASATPFPGERGRAAGSPRPEAHPVRHRAPASPGAPRARRDPRRGARLRLGLDRRPRGDPPPDARPAGGAELPGGADAAGADRPVRVPPRAPSPDDRREAGRVPRRAVGRPRHLRGRRRRRVPEGVRGVRRAAPGAWRPRRRGHRRVPGALGAVPGVLRGPLHAVHRRRRRAEARPAGRPADLDRRAVRRRAPARRARRGRLDRLPRHARAVPGEHREDPGLRPRGRPAAGSRASFEPAHVSSRSSTRTRRRRARPPLATSRPSTSSRSTIWPGSTACSDLPRPARSGSRTSSRPACGRS